MKAHQVNLIGKQIKVIASRNEQLIGVEGTVMDETKNTITINNKTIIKDHVTIAVNGMELTGEDLLKQAQDRIKVKK